MVIQIMLNGAEAEQNLAARDAFLERLSGMDGVEIDGTGTGAGFGANDVFLNTTDAEAPEPRAPTKQVVLDAGLAATIGYVPTPI